MSNLSHWIPLNLGQISKVQRLTNKWQQLNIIVLSLFASLGKDLRVSCPFILPYSGNREHMAAEKEKGK